MTEDKRHKPTEFLPETRQPGRKKEKTLFALVVSFISLLCNV